MRALRRVNSATPLKRKLGRGFFLYKSSSPSELGDPIEAWPPAVCVGATLPPLRRVNSATPLKPRRHRRDPAVGRRALRRVNSATPLKLDDEPRRIAQTPPLRRVNSATPLKPVGFTELPKGVAETLRRVN